LEGEFNAYRNVVVLLLSWLSFVTSVAKKATNVSSLLKLLIFVATRRKLTYSGHSALAVYVHTWSIDGCLRSNTPQFKLFQINFHT